jgi:hypothetical protein
MGGDTSEVLGSLLQQLGGGGVTDIARTVGVSSGDVTNVLSGAVPAILAGLTRNSATSSGAAGLAGALDRDHDGSILDDVAGYLMGGGDLSGGAGILGHVFGGSQPNVERTISKSSGVDLASVGKIMAMVAPLIMGALGREKRQHGFGASDLANALGRQEKAAQKASPAAADIFSRMLDSDGDGDATDDIVNMGAGLLGSLFK